MLKQIFVVFTITLLFLCDIAAGESREVLVMPKDFEGISIGMALPDFLKIRPQVRPGGLGPTHEQKVDVTKPNQSLSEGIENDPLFSLSMIGMYSFRDGKLKHMIIIWVGDIEKIRKHRPDFLSSCEKRWGTDYQKKIKKIEPKTKNEHLAPLLLWQKGNTMIAVVCTSEYEDKTLKEGAFMINLFSKDDKEIMGIFAGEEVDKNVRSKLFDNIGITP